MPRFVVLLVLLAVGALMSAALCMATSPPPSGCFGDSSYTGEDYGRGADCTAALSDLRANVEADVEGTCDLNGICSLYVGTDSACVCNPNYCSIRGYGIFWCNL